MACVLCRPFRWAYATPDADCQSLRNELRRKLAAWRYGQANDAEILRHDPDRQATKSAAALFRTEPEAAVQELRTLAQRGSIWSMMLLGWAYNAGIGMAADRSQAEYWYRRAVDGGCQQAVLRLGHLYWEREDFAECEVVYGAGAAALWPPAMYYLGRLKLRKPETSQRLKESRILLTQAANGGDIGAHLLLANMFMRGRYGWYLIPHGVRLFIGAVIKADALIEQARPDADRTGADQPAPSPMLAA